MEFLLESFMHLEPLSKIIVILAIIAVLSSLNSYLFPHKKPKDNTQKYKFDFKGIKGEVHIKD